VPKIYSVAPRFWSQYRIHVMLIPKLNVTYFYISTLRIGDPVAQWLRCCVTNRKVAGSIPAGATGIFH